jgi:ribosomal protein S6--L-glutamate ligase
VHIGILGNPRSWYGRELERAARERGHRFTRLDFGRLMARTGSDGTTDLQSVRPADTGGLETRPGGERAALTCADLNLTSVDAVIVRTMPPGSLEQVVYRMDALARLDAAGVTVLNPPKAIECAVDKYLTTARLALAGLPVPQTIVCEDADSALAAFAELGGDVVVKPIFGSEGRGILRVSDPDLALRAFRTLERIQAVLYLQRFIEHEGFDVRALVLDGRILGGMRRRSPHDFRTNVARQATAEPYDLTEQEREWALRAAQAVGTRFAGIDILYDRLGNGYVIEVNAVPGWRAFQKTTGVDVAALVVGRLEQETEPRRHADTENRSLRRM